jgi:hypothetical protein
MTQAIFIVGIIVFLVTVYGTVVVGGLLLTGRQLDEHPHMAPESFGQDKDDDAGGRARAIVNADF